MKVQQLRLTGETAWTPANGDAPLDGAQAVLAFLSPLASTAPGAAQALRDMFPGADVIACSTGGEILDRDVLDGGGVAVALAFARSKTRLATAAVTASADSYEAGAALGRQLAADDLSGVFVLSEGLLVNGSELVRGLRDRIGSAPAVTGGLAGDGADFTVTRVGANEAPRPGRVAAIGLYGPAVRIAHGNAGGWEEFGPKRVITRAEGNKLYELDGKPALDLYKRYLGPEAENLPSSALLFPLKVGRGSGAGHETVRTILAVDEDEQSLTFAGDIPQGETAQLMMGNFDRLISGAGEAAASAAPTWDCPPGESVGILVSCIGRKLLLGQRTSEELDAVGAQLGGVPLVGFYSYGELSPHAASGMCELHNQTMTITLLGEAG